MTSQSVVQESMECRIIYQAAAGGEMELLEYRKSKVGSFATPGAKNTILHVHIIAQSTKKDKAPTLMDKLVYVLVESPEEKTARLSAAAGKNVEEMLKWCPALLWEVNAAGDTPLHMAARHGKVHIAKVLIDRAKSEGKDVESEESMVWKMLHMVNKEKETALHQAARYQHNEVVRLLLDEDSPDYKYSPNEDGETPLYIAAERGNFDIVKMMVERYNSPTYEGPHGTTALHAAAAMRCHAACTAIVEKEGLEFLTTTVDERGRTPLHYGGISLLKHDRSAAFVLDKEGKTALHVLAGEGCDLMVNQFIELCPECLEVEDSRGRNALHYAVESGDKDTVEVILKSEYLGDLLKKKDNEGLTPLHLLALKRFYIPNLMKDHRLDKMAVTAKDLTPSDIIFTSSNHSRIDMQLGDSMHEAGIKPGWRSLIRSESKIIDNFDQDQTHTNNKVITKSSGDEEDDLKEDRQNHLVVAALIATVTFAAGFTLPGGYNQDDPNIGQAVLTKQTAFQVFVILNTLAMVLSSAAVFIHLLIAMNKKKLLRLAEISKRKSGGTTREKMIANLQRRAEVSDLFGKALPITLVGIVTMVLAFIAGSYAVLSHARVLAIAVCVTGSLFFGLFWYLWKELVTLSKQVLQMVVVVLCVLVMVVVIGPIALVYYSLAGPIIVFMMLLALKLVGSTLKGIASATPVDTEQPATVREQEPELHTV